MHEFLHGVSIAVCYIFATHIPCISYRKRVRPRSSHPAILSKRNKLRSQNLLCEIF